MKTVKQRITHVQAILDYSYILAMIYKLKARERKKQRSRAFYSVLHNPLCIVWEV